MGNINFGKENGNIQEGAQGGYQGGFQGGYQGEYQEGYQGNFQGTGETTFNGGMPEEKAGSIAGALEQPQGYVGVCHKKLSSQQQIMFLAERNYSSNR